MARTTVFMTHRSQAVRLPAETRFPPGVREVEVRVVGAARVISPVDASWDAFFDREERPTDDFLAVRGDQHQPDRPGL